MSTKEPRVMMGKLTTAIEMDITFEFVYIPEERRTKDHPGYPEEIEVIGMALNGVRLTTEQFQTFWTTLEEDAKIDIEGEIMEYIANKREQAELDHASDLAEWLFYVAAKMATFQSKEGKI